MNAPSFRFAVSLLLRFPLVHGRLLVLDYKFHFLDMCVLFGNMGPCNCAQGGREGPTGETHADLPKPFFLGWFILCDHVHFCCAWREPVQGSNLDVFAPSSNQVHPRTADRDLTVAGHCSPRIRRC